MFFPAKQMEAKRILNFKWMQLLSLSMQEIDSTIEHCRIDLYVT